MGAKDGAFGTLGGPQSNSLAYCPLPSLKFSKVNPQALLCGKRLYCVLINVILFI